MYVRWTDVRHHYHLYLHALNKTKDSDYYDNTLIYRPRNKINFTAGCSFYSISILFDYAIVGNQFSDKANVNTISKYKLLNSSLSYSLKIYELTMNFSLKAKNLLNEDYILMKDYPLPGREILFSVGIEYWYTAKINKILTQSPQSSQFDKFIIIYYL